MCFHVMCCNLLARIKVLCRAGKLTNLLIRGKIIFFVYFCLQTSWEGTGNGAGLFLKAKINRRKGKTYNFGQGKFLLDIKEDFTMSTVKYWSILARGIVEFTSLEILKSQLSNILSNLTHWACFKQEYELDDLQRPFSFYIILLAWNCLKESEIGCCL